MQFASNVGTHNCSTCDVLLTCYRDASVWLVVHMTATVIPYCHEEDCFVLQVG